MNKRPWHTLLPYLLCSAAIACSNDGASGSGSSAGTAGAMGGGLGAGGAANAVGGGEIVSYPRQCSDLYEESLLPEFNVEISDAHWAEILDECDDGLKEYHPVVLHYDNESVDAMFRLKGAWSRNCDKMQFVISFNEVNSDGRFHGLRKIVLDAPWYDETLIHERLAFEFLKGYGVPYSCVNNARLSINGEYYGLYANVERVDREYLERHFENPDGNLFKEGLELKTNEDTATTAAVDAYWEAETLSEIEDLVDVQQAVDVWAGLAMIADPDSYWAGVEINFYLYELPTRGLLFLPYDMDTAFAEWSLSADPITYEHEHWQRELHYETVLSDPTWCAAFETAMGRARDAYDVAMLEEKIEAWSTQIATALEEDPHRTFTLDEHEQALSALRTFPERRAEFVDAWLAEASHCPPDWPERP